MPVTNYGVLRISASDTTFSGTVRITGGANITVGTDASGVTISGGAGGGFSGGASNLGNTAGATGVTGTRLVLVGTNNVTLSQTTDANGGTISISAAGGGAGQFSGGISNLGNTAGSSGITGTQNVFVGTNVISLSQSTGANGATISIDGPASTSLSAYTNITLSTTGSTIKFSVATPDLISRWDHNSAAWHISVSGTSSMANTTVSVIRIQIPDRVTFTRLDIPMTLSLATSATANTANILISNVAILYSRNASTLNAIVGTSQTTTHTWASNTGNYSSLTGAVFFSIPLATSLTPGEYYLGWQLSTNNNSSIGTATTALANTFGPIHGSTNSAGWRDLGSASQITTSPAYGQGLVNTSLSHTTQTMQLSQITMTGTAGIRANNIVIFRNV